MQIPDPIIAPTKWISREEPERQFKFSGESCGLGSTLLSLYNILQVEGTCPGPFFMADWITFHIPLRPMLQLCPIVFPQWFPEIHVHWQSPGLKEVNGDVECQSLKSPEMLTSKMQL